MTPLHLDSSPHQTAVPLPTPHPSIPPQFPPKIHTNPPEVFGLYEQVFLPPPSPLLFPLSPLTSPSSPCIRQRPRQEVARRFTPGLAQAERRRRPPRQQRKQPATSKRAHNNRIRLKRGGRGGHCTHLRRGWSPTRHPPNTERVRAPLLFPAPDRAANSPYPAECQGWGLQPPLFSSLVLFKVMMRGMSMGSKQLSDFRFLSLPSLQACF